MNIEEAIKELEIVKLDYLTQGNINRINKIIELLQETNQKDKKATYVCRMYDIDSEEVWDATIVCNKKQYTKDEVKKIYRKLRNEWSDSDLDLVSFLEEEFDKQYGIDFFNSTSEYDLELDF